MGFTSQKSFRSTLSYSETFREPVTIINFKRGFWRRSNRKFPLHATSENNLEKKNKIVIVQTGWTKRPRTLFASQN